MSTSDSFAHDKTNFGGADGEKLIIVSGGFSVEWYASSCREVTGSS